MLATKVILAAKFYVLTVVQKIQVVWDVMPYWLVNFVVQTEIGILLLFGCFVSLSRKDRRE
jgi:hypothetical protein